MEEKSKYIIAKFADNWADEMGIEGVDVMLREDFFTLYDIVKDIDLSIEVGIGTNEDLRYPNGPALLNCITVEDVDEDFALKFIEKIGSIGFSPFEIIYNVLEWHDLIPEGYEEDDNDNDNEDNWWEEDDDDDDDFDMDESMAETR